MSEVKVVSVDPAAEVVEITFKGRRRAYYTNPREIPVHVGDYVVVQAERGEDLGRVHHTNEWVKHDHLTGPVRQVLRGARPEDLDQLERNRAREERAFRICKERVVQRDIEMKVVDCEYQLDGNRITFFFTAERRIDFRDLVKDLASTLRTRIELRQIGVRDESGRIGGVGTCGRELCCATWLREFEPITLKMAKDQGLSPSPSKISGACGRLKCCLRYELDFYKEAAREFPKIGSRLTLADGEWEVARVDIFRRRLGLTDEGGRENEIELSALPTGTKVVGPTRDRRKGCDKNECGSRGARPGDGESGRPRGDRPPGGGGSGGGDRPRGDRPYGGGDRPHGDRPQGERHQGERPRHGRHHHQPHRPPHPPRDGGSSHEGGPPREGGPRPDGGYGGPPPGNGTPRDEGPGTE